MKKFVFSLEKLMRYKEQMLDIERGILAEMNALLSRYRLELQQMILELRQRADAFNQQLVVGMLPSDIMVQKSYIRQLESAIEQKRRQLELQELATDKQTEKVRGAKIELSSMENLKEKRFEEYTSAVTKAEEQFIEEFVSNARAMGTAG